MNKKNLFITASLLAALAACSQIPKEAYYNRGQPESLLDDTSEVVNFRIQSPASIEEITDMINKNQPSRADIRCSEGDMLCGEVKGVMRQFGVPVKYSSASDNTIALIYERIQARDCENRYIDNTINPYNLNYPTFGCSIAVNQVQMVSDKRTFTHPALMDNPEAYKAVQNYGFYSLPSVYTPPRADSNFNDIATQSTLQTNGLTGGSGR